MLQQTLPKLNIKPNLFRDGINATGGLTLWNTFTEPGTAVFTGEVGETYGFWSVATDEAGNVQIVDVLIPDAKTQVRDIVNLAPEIDMSDSISALEFKQVAFRPTASDPNHCTPTWSLVGSYPTGMSICSASGLIKLSEPPKSFSGERLLK